MYDSTMTMETLLELEAVAAELNAMRELEGRRNELIVRARVEGEPWAKIVEASGVSLRNIKRLAEKANDGVLPKPEK